MFNKKKEAKEVKVEPVQVKLEPIREEDFALGLKLIQRAIDCGQIQYKGNVVKVCQVGFVVEMWHHNISYLPEGAGIAFAPDSFDFLSPKVIEENRIAALKLELQKAKETNDLAVKKIEELSRALGVAND